MWIGSNNREPDEPVWNFLSKFVMLYILPFFVHCSRQQTRSKPRASSAATSTWIQCELKCKCKQMKSISCSPIMNANLTYKPVHEGIKPLLFRSLTVTALQKHKESKKCNFWGVIRVFFFLQIVWECLQYLHSLRRTHHLFGRHDGADEDAGRN